MVHALSPHCDGGVRQLRDNKSTLGTFGGGVRAEPTSDLEIVNIKFILKSGFFKSQSNTHRSAFHPLKYDSCLQIK